MKNKKLYPWIVVGLLWVVALLNYMDRQMLSTMKSAMMVDIVELESAANFGRLMAVFLWIYGFMSPVAGMVADRVNRKWLIVGSLFVWSFVTLMMGYCTDFNQIYYLRALMGVSEALYIPAGLSLITDYHQEKTRSLAVGIHMTGLYVGQALGGFGATVASAYTWETTFHWFGIIGIAYSVVLIIFLHDKKDHGVIAGGILSDKWIQRNVRGRVYTGAIGLALTIPSLLLLGFGHNFPMIIGGGLCFGIGYGIFDANNMPILCQFISPRYRATAYGIMNMTGVFAGAAITDILGKSTDAGNLGHDFAMLAGLVLIALLIQVIFLRPKVANMTDEC